MQTFRHAYVSLGDGIDGQYFPNVITPFNQALEGCSLSTTVLLGLSLAATTDTETYLIESQDNVFYSEPTFWNAYLIYLITEL